MNALERVIKAERAFQAARASMLRLLAARDVRVRYTDHRYRPSIDAEIALYNEALEELHAANEESVK